MYTIKKHEPYYIEGAEGKKYSVPAPANLDIDDAETMIRFNEAQDPKEKLTICKAFILKYAPELEQEGIGAMEYFMIFQDYNLTYADALGK